MLRLCSLALCLAIVSSSAISIKRKIGNDFRDIKQHPAARQHDKVKANLRMPVVPPKNPIPSECKEKISNDKCKEPAPRGGTFLTNLEGTSLGPGFPPKPVGLLVRPNISREEASSTSAPEGEFLVDGKPPMPPPPLKRRPLPNRRVGRPLQKSGERQDLSQENIDPMILGPLFYEDLWNTKSTTRIGENSQGESRENTSGSVEKNRALLDSFNELDHPDPKLLSKLKGKLYPKYYADKRNSEQKGNEEFNGPKAEDRSNGNSEEADNSGEDDENSRKSVEEEAAVSAEDVPAEETSEEDNEDNPEEEHISHHAEEQESEEQQEEEPELVSHHDKQTSLEEDENLPNGHSIEEEHPEDSEEEGSTSPKSHTSEEELESPPLIRQNPNESLENSGQNSSSTIGEEGTESEESAEGGEQNIASDEAVYSDEESSEDTDYSEENNGIDLSAHSKEETYDLSVEEGASDESGQKPASSSEETNEIRPSSIESQEEVDEDYDSREQYSQEQHSREQQSEERSEEQQSQEQHSQEQLSEESPENSSSEYDEEERPSDYNDTPDYDNASPESEYEDLFPKPEQEPTKKPQVYYKKRPATFYYIVGGSVGEKKETNKDSSGVENGSKPLDYEDDKIKQSEVHDSAEERPSSISDDSFSSMGFESFDLDSVLKRPQIESDSKTTKSPVAVITNTTPQTDATKCDDKDTKKDEEKLTTPKGTSKPNTLQPGDVVSITRAHPVNFGLSPTFQTTTSTFRPATISAIGIVKPGGSIIAKVVSPTLQVHSSTPSPATKAEATEAPRQVPWKILMAAREATALTYLKPPPIGQEQTWFLRRARAPRYVDFLPRPL